MATYFKPQCKCESEKKCTCGASWYFKVNLGVNPETGKPRQVKRGGFTKKQDAIDACAELIIQNKNGYVVNESNLTFEEFSKQWYEMYKSSGRIKNSTLLLRTIELRRLNRHLAKLKIKDVRREHVQNAVNRLSEKLAKASMLGTLAVCRMVFTKAYEMDLIKRNPTEFVEIPTKVLTLEEYENQFTLPKFLEKDELVQFLDIVKDCGDELDYPIFLTLAYTGMRSGELCGLMWKDIDFERNEISINRTMFTPTNTPPGYELQTPKTRRSKRTISVAPNVINELRKLQKVQREFVMRYRNEFQDLGFVFANLHFHRGLPTIQLRIKHQFQMFLGIIKIKEHLTPHSLRHTHASLLAQAGVSLEAIMERLGHSNDRVTREIYLHITEHTKKEASDKFAKLLDSI